MTGLAPAGGFAFGLQLYQAADAKAWQEQARRAADLGYRSVHLPDHLGGQFSPLLGLAAAAAAAPGLRVGTLVLNCAIRHPVPLAKELTTLDVLTDGRLEVGLGAGWQHADFTRSGTGLLSPAQRVRRLAESVTVLEALWQGRELTHNGEFFEFTGARGLPRPVQPALPLLIGGGSVNILTLAGQRAQVVGLDVPQPAGHFEPRPFVLAASWPAHLRRAGWARTAATAAGRDITLQMQVPAGLVHLGRAAAGAAPAVASEWNVSTDELMDCAVALIGDVSEVAERLLRWREESGVSYVVVPAEAVDACAPLVDRLAGR